MTNLERQRHILAKFFTLGEDILFKLTKDLGWAQVYISDIITDEFCNQANILNLEENSNEKLRQIEQYMVSMSRKPAVYFSPWSTLKDIPGLMQAAGYEFSFEDAWMMLSREHGLPKWEETKEIVHIGTNLELANQFGEVVKKAYAGEKTPENPYGGIPMDNFIRSCQRVFLDPAFINRVEGYLITDGSHYVAAGVLLLDETTGYIAGIGSIPEVRGQGFGKKISQYAAQRSRHLGCELTFLATETGSRNEDFYNRLGFKTEFTGTCYVKKEI